MNNQTKTALLWLMLIICMMLHFDYHVSYLFYGIDIKNKDAQGVVPASILYIRSAFHFLPLLYIAVIMWFSQKPVRTGNLVLSILYFIAHICHLAEEIKSGSNPSQLLLLSITALLALLLLIAALQWLREIKAGITTDPVNQD